MSCVNVNARDALHSEVLQQLSPTTTTPKQVAISGVSVLLVGGLWGREGGGAGWGTLRVVPGVTPQALLDLVSGNVPPIEALCKR